MNAINERVMKGSLHWIAGLVVAALCSCATGRYEGIGYEAGTHEFPVGTTPWADEHHQRVSEQGFEVVQGKFRTPGMFPKEIVDVDPDASPFTYLGLKERGSFTMLTVKEANSLVTVSSYIHAEGNARQRKAYQRKSLSWLRGLIVKGNHPWAAVMKLSTPLTRP